MRRSDRDQRVKALAELLGLTELLERKPGQLSGGQRQRVALGRAIIRDPSVFLMDEPLSNLDAMLRVQMRAEIANLQSRLGTTTIYVTHDQAEAMTLGSRVAVLHEGRLQQCDAPRALYDRPANMMVASFIGSPSMSFCEVAVTNGSVALGGVEIHVAAQGRPRLVVGLRPESLELAANGVQARVEMVEELGADAFVFCTAELAGQPTKLVARADARSAPARGQNVALRPKPEEAHIFDPESGARLQ